MTDRRLSGRRIIVLGGTGGLGGAVVERFRADGAAVLVADARLPADADRHADVDYVGVDALDEASVSAAFATEPAPDAVVNLIGGYTPPQPLSALDIDVLRQQLDLNLVTAAIVTKHAMPLLAARGGGPIVHVSSRVATEKGENGFAYSVSKLGVVAWSRRPRPRAASRGCGSTASCPASSTPRPTGRPCPTPAITAGRSRPSSPPSWPSSSQTMPSSSPARPSPSTAGPRVRFQTSGSGNVLVQSGRAWQPLAPP